MRKIFVFYVSSLVQCLLLFSCSMENDLLDENIEALTKRNKLIVTICTDAYVSVGGGGYVYKDTYCRSCYVDEGYQLEEDEFYAGGFPEDGEWVDRGSGGGGGGSQPHYYVGDSWTFKFPNLNNIYGMTSTLNAYQKGRLEGAIETLFEMPYDFRDIYNKIIANNTQIPFKVDPTIPGLGAFIENDTSIVFLDDNQINADVLIEEVIHAVQFLFFYGDIMDDEITNFEFEAKVFKDFTYQVSLYYDEGKGGPLSAILGFKPDVAAEYEKWLRKWANLGYLPPSEYATFHYFGALWNYNNKGTYIPYYTVPKLLESVFRKPRPKRDY